MDDKILYPAAVGLSALALLLMIITVCLVNGNRTLQGEIQGRQNAINSSVSMSQLNQNLAQALAQTAIDNNDQDIHDLLAAQGITVKAKKK